MKRFAALVLAILWASIAAFAQSIDIGRNKEDSGTYADLVVNVSIDQVQSRAGGGLRVKLSGSGIGTMGQGGQQTDSTGRVEFHVTAGVYQITITGPGIEQYD